MPPTQDFRHLLLHTLAPELLVLSLFLALGLSLDLTPPRVSSFFERDPSLSYPLVSPPAVPNAMLAGLSFALPAALLLLLEAVSRYFKGQPPTAWLTIALGHSLSAAILATNAIKNFVGKHRPRFFATCGYAGYDLALATNNISSPAWAAYEAATHAGAPGSLSRCTAAPAEVWDAQRSFPSGHASISFAGLVFLSLALRALAGARRGEWFSLRAVGCGAPLALAAYIAATRVFEHHHSPADVTCGALIGGLAAAAAWAHARGAGRAPPPLLGGAAGESMAEGGEAAAAAGVALQVREVQQGAV